jgi:hypothetical protein
MIDMSKQYRTRDNHKVRIYATDGSRGNIHGAILNDDFGWDIMTWRSDGSRMQCEQHKHDLFEVKPRHKRTVWLHVFKNSTVCATEEPAYNVTNRIACIKVELDFEEGEGL